MWAFLSGVKKPAQNKRNYEENRKERSFKVSWTAGRQWLQYKDGKMFCTFCKEAGVISDFCRGSTSFRIDSVKKHENSDSHKHSTVVATNKTKEPGTRPAEKALQNLNKENVKKLEILFKTAHALAKNNRPYSDFEWICGLDVAKGLVLGTTYITDKYCRKFVNAIAEVERNRTKEAVEKVKFLSILCDGSTDQGIIDNEIVYLRMVVQGKAEVKFIGCMQVTKADARGVFHAMKRAVEGVGLDWSKTLKKMVGLGSDGAAVMTGKKAGVAALLKQQHPSIISIHCLAHRLELAYKDALKGIKIGEKVVSGLLLGLYYFYHNSPLNRANLKESYKTLGIDMKMPTRVGGTRWVGHVLLALKNMFHGYAAIKQHLYQLAFGSGVQAIAKSKALGLYKILVDDNNITFAAFLLDILSLLHIMSQVFQREESCVADIHRALNSCLSSLNRFSEILW
ncbi:zinc finger protein 862-like isoform X1 [Saccostrea cucullata]|uniref:zinc finger protein 862-like isoform X1 n=1 Tax=Saccostrea cuccullata TaxID=36930 RepID=UPI002ED29207